MELVIPAHVDSEGIHENEGFVGGDLISGEEVFDDTEGVFFDPVVDAVRGGEGVVYDFGVVFPFQGGLIDGTHFIGPVGADKESVREREVFAVDVGNGSVVAKDGFDFGFREAGSGVLEHREGVFY